MQILTEHIKKYKNTQCEKRTSFNIVPNHKITIENVESITVNELWSDIEINYENTVINIEKDLEIAFNTCKKQKKMTGYSSANTPKINLSEVLTLSDFIPDKKIKEKIRECVIGYGKSINKPDIYGIDGVYKSNTYSNLYFLNIGTLMFNYMGGNSGLKPSDSYMEPNFIEFLSNKCPKLNVFTSNIELWLIFRHYNFTFDSYKQTPIKNVLIFDTDITVENTDLQFNQTGKCTLFTRQKINNSIEFPALYKKYFQEEQKMTNVISWGDEGKEQETTNDEIKFSITSPTHSKAELYEKFQNFVNYINSYIDQSDTKKPVKSYIIKIETVTKKTTVPNKKYIEYKKQKDALFELAKLIKDDKNKDGEISDIEMRHKIAEFMKIPIPQEEKKKITTEKKIVVTEINEIYKSFDTLYLREDDKFKLKNVLEMFKDENETWKEMGIPNKLGILLHGTMGTGKSSTISAIATYLQKNLYCVDFKTIKTNSDFLMVVDYVNKNCLGGGILTFEDFDAMGNVLHKRVDNSEIVNSNVDLYNSSKQELTLDFILNVFQGSMTPSGFVFVATTNHLDVLDEALHRDGRFDIKIEMKLCDYYQIQCIYNKLIGRVIKDQILKKIEENKWTPANIIFRVMHYVRGDHTDDIILEPFLNELVL